ncbi:phosphoribosylglycinamide formyltransferase [Candidatus Undinarchaeota archaeon]
MTNIGVLVSGRGSNLQAIIDNVESGYIPGKITVIISNKEDAFGLERARKHNIPAEYVPMKKGEPREEYDARVIEVLDKYNVDLVCLAGYMLIVSKPFVNKYKNAMINIHPALLPAFAGGIHAQQEALDWGVKVSGCTVHFVTNDIDSGPIIVQKAVPVLEDDTVQTLSARIIEQEHKAFPEAIKLFCEGRLKVQGREVMVLPEK